jgi:hypothetical protein
MTKQQKETLRYLSGRKACATELVRQHLDKTCGSSFYGFSYDRTHAVLKRLAALDLVTRLPGRPAMWEITNLGRNAL